MCVECQAVWLHESDLQVIHFIYCTSVHESYRCTCMYHWNCYTCSCWLLCGCNSRHFALAIPNRWQVSLTYLSTCLPIHLCFVEHCVVFIIAPTYMSWVLFSFWISLCGTVFYDFPALTCGVILTICCVNCHLCLYKLNHNSLRCLVEALYCTQQLTLVLIEWILLYIVHNKPLSYCSIADTSPDWVNLALYCTQQTTELLLYSRH